jgi:hypothetical protein
MNKMWTRANRYIEKIAWIVGETDDLQAVRPLEDTAAGALFMRNSQFLDAAYFENLLDSTNENEDDADEDEKE